MLHREIKYLLEEDRQINLHNIGEQHYEYNELANKGEHCSDTERRADEATFEVAAWLKCQFMEDKIGQSFEAIIVNVVNFGLFVMIEKWHIDGLVYVGNMGGEFFEYDAQQQTLIGTFSHRVFKIGDKLDVIVKDIDLSNKRINFIFDNKKNRQSGAKKS
jgi:ribonuclease R